MIVKYSLIKEHTVLALFPILSFTSCSEQSPSGSEAKNPDTAPKAVIDRFSEKAGNLMVRSDGSGLPEPNEPIDFDKPPFITEGLSPEERVVKYYNFDVQPVIAAPIYAFFYESDKREVEGQLKVMDVIPGDPEYNDFWQIVKVYVPNDYQPNTITKVSEIFSLAYPVEKTNIIVNCPVVPNGSTAKLRYLSEENSGLVMAWYEGMIVFYLLFVEKEIIVDHWEGQYAEMPASDIFVSFNINPGEVGGGYPSGFKTETGSVKTHNVLSALPEHENYSPLWNVNIYDNKDFDAATNLSTAVKANILLKDAALVNCPVVYIEK